MFRETVLGLLGLSALHGAPPAVQSLRPFQERVEWQEGAEALPWSTALLGADGKERYHLTLRPLWAVEGGIVAMEVVLAMPGRPDENLLGQRDTAVTRPFVITVEELAAGIERSKYGRKRIFRLPPPDRETLRVEILASDLRGGPAIRRLALNLTVATGSR